MTAEAIDALPAGPELDTLIAQHVMHLEWDETRCRVCGWAITPSLWPTHGCTSTSCSLRPPPARRADAPAPYSTELWAAWLVVEELGRRERPVRLQDSLAGMWSAWCWPATNSESYGETPMLALCRAALKAVGYAT
jgi:hypothetical protein